MPIPPGFRRRGIGALVPANVPQRLRPWTADSAVAPIPNPPAAPNLEQEADEQQAFFKSFSGRSLASPQAQVFDQRAPWLERPASAEPAFVNRRVAMPANDGLDYEVLAFTLPFGWDGAIEHLAWTYTGPGFIGGSGDLTWRLLRNGQAIKGYDAILFAIGQISTYSIQPFVLPSKIREFSGERISLVVSHAVASALPIIGTYIIGIVGHYSYPRPGNL